MKKTILAVVVSFFVLTGSNSFAQIFISFDGVKGESTFKAFPSSTEISTLSWGAKNATTISGDGGRATVGRVQVSELIITKPRGGASPALQMLVFYGKSIPKVEIRFYKHGLPNAGPYLTITLEDVLITNWAISSDGQGIPMESFSLVFVRFKTEDAISKPDGTTEKLPAVGWDIQKNSSY